ncbi:YqaJ viral recombinase family protein [Paraburkholderia terrae]|uniref:YqaJ viral recombinase family nuclease n=1 Tax=Paraburkholderia terrae TaxID=311230 RepID=UPI001EE1AFC4|nr:YqaJ viral recombinase family protein [Paraburkholderia terrae]GJH00260.1 YqaJ viral recombinase family protein [Paraburkholderia terrae]
MQLVREVLVPENEAAWLAMRAQDLTSTEVAALFGASPYMTEYELYLTKTGQLAAQFEETDRIKWGKRLEAPIAFGVAEDRGLEVEPFKNYIRIPELRMGSSFDFVILPGEGYKRGLMEIKNVDGLQFKRAWIEGGDDADDEAPPHIEFQVQHQMEVADIDWCLIVALVGGNTPKIIARQRDPEIGALIRQRVAEFWNRVHTGNAPRPNFSKDADTLARQYRDNDGSTIDLSENPHLTALCKAYKDGGEKEKEGKAEKEAAKAEILTIIEHAKSITADGFKISAGTNKVSYRSYDRAAGLRVSINVSQLPAVHVDAEVAPFRNVRITATA